MGRGARHLHPVGSRPAGLDAVGRGLQGLDPHPGPVASTVRRARGAGAVVERSCSASRSCVLGCRSCRRRHARGRGPGASDRRRPPPRDLHDDHQHRPACKEVFAITGDPERDRRPRRRRPATTRVTSPRWTEVTRRPRTCSWSTWRAAAVPTRPSRSRGRRRPAAAARRGGARRGGRPRACCGCASARGPSTTILGLYHLDGCTLEAGHLRERRPGRAPDRRHRRHRVRRASAGRASIPRPTSSSYEATLLAGARVRGRHHRVPVGRRRARAVARRRTDGDRSTDDLSEVGRLPLRRPLALGASRRS